jgi:MFS family permease
MGIAGILKKVVRNDAMKTDPEEIYNWRVFAVVAGSCFGGMLFGWDTGAIGGVLAMKATQERFNYTPEAKVTLDQNIVSTLQAGCFAACFFTSYFTEKYGRRWCLIGTGTVTTIGVILQAASTAQGSLPIMYVGRFVAGLGVGAASSLVPLYVSECAPRAIRGGLTSFYQLFIVTGVMLSFWINYGALLHLSAPTVYALPLALQALPAVLLIACMLAAPESPRWCARKDDWERAKSILIGLRQ